MTLSPWRTLRQARKNARLSVAQLAALSGVSTSYIKLLESGERDNPTTDKVRRLANALGCKVADSGYGFDLGPTDLVARIEDIAAAHADLGARLDSLQAAVAQQGG